MSTAWRELVSPEGKPYYHNSETNKTQWDRPPELDGAPPAAAPTPMGPWLANTLPDGRTYYYRKLSNGQNETTWTKPDDFNPNQPPATPTTPSKPNGPAFVAGGAPTFQPPQRDSHRLPERPDRHDPGPRDRGFDRPREFGPGEGYRAGIVTGVDDVTYSPEEAKAAFAKLLKRIGVQPDWTWEQTMKAAITEPQYRAIKDPKERQNAFRDYVRETEEQDKERAQQRVEKLREDFTKMLKHHPEIKHYTRWKTARPTIAGETVFKSARDETERQQLYDEYILGLQKVHREREVADRKSANGDLVGLLRSLKFDPYVRWSDARDAIYGGDEFQSDAKFKSLTQSDVLLAFQDHVKDLERDFYEKDKQKKSQKIRKERRRRDGFINMMREMRGEGKIKAGTKWKDVRTLIENDPRYDNLLGQSGSTPIDFFWDAVEDEEREYRGMRNEALDALDDAGFVITSQTTFDQFADIMKNDTRTKKFTEADIQLCFDRFHDKVLRREQEDSLNAERRTRHNIDKLRSVIKHLRPPINVDDSWEDVKPRVEKYPEYQSLETDEDRKAAFNKVLKRAIEREADDQAREQEKAIRRAERDREDRYMRYSHHGETDAYEADRRKAQAARERQYRKASGTGLSPTRHRDDRYDRHYRHDRERERERGGYYDFDRELHRGREQTYRAKLSDPSGELDYGDGGRAGSSISSTTVGRRRRDSVDEDGEVTRRDSKRLRRDSKHSGKSGEDDTEMRDLKEEAEKKAKEEENLKSGSEEGEIEEV